MLLEVLCHQLELSKATCLAAISTTPDEMFAFFKLTQSIFYPANCLFFFFSDWKINLNISNIYHLISFCSSKLPLGDYLLHVTSYGELNQVLFSIFFKCLGLWGVWSAHLIRLLLRHPSNRAVKKSQKHNAMIEMATVRQIHVFFYVFLCRNGIVWYILLLLTQPSIIYQGRLDHKKNPKLFIYLHYKQK